VGFLVLPPIFGVIAERYGYRPMWWLAGVLPFAAIVVYLLPERLAPPEPAPTAHPAPGPRARPRPS
jgi:MFS family permease